jgi:uncharacterized protein YkwD
LAGACAAAAILAGCTSTPEPTDQITNTAAVSLGSPSDYARTVFDLVNAERASAGLSELVWNDCLASAAAVRASHTLDEELLSHEPLAAGCTSGNRAGENLARTWQEPSGMVKLWLDSPSHHDNLLGSAWTDSGVGCVAYSFEDTAVEASPGAPVGGMACSQLFEGPGE